jgi:uncharacterized membrane protein YkvA (DUF1232 family)
VAPLVSRPESSTGALEWAHSLSYPARYLIKPLISEATAVTAAQLTERIDAHLQLVHDACRKNEFIDIERAKLLAKTARRLALTLHRLAELERTIAAAAILYFVTVKDAHDDLAAVIGFDDDEEVLRAALTHLGLEQLLEEGA